MNTLYFKPLKKLPIPRLPLSCARSSSLKAVFTRPMALLDRNLSPGLPDVVTIPALSWPLGYLVQYYNIGFQISLKKKDSELYKKGNKELKSLNRREKDWPPGKERSRITILPSEQSRILFNHVYTTIIIILYYQCLLFLCRTKWSLFDSSTK